MKDIFADSFFFLARLNPTDQWHKRAVAYRIPPNRPLLTTSWVLVETADALAGHQTRQEAAEFVQAVLCASDMTVVAASEDLFERGLGLYAMRRDKDWSLTDCISFVVMADHGIADALTGDHHFEQAGL